MLGYCLAKSWAQARAEASNACWPIVACSCWLLPAAAACWIACCSAAWAWVAQVSIPRLVISTASVLTSVPGP